MKDLEITGPFQILSTDMTYVPTAKGFEYHVQIMDVYTKQVMASVQEPNIKVDLVIVVLDRATNQHVLPQGTIFHLDREVNTLLSLL